MQANTFEITLEDAYMISTHVKNFSFKIEQPAVFNYQAGQFITIYFDVDAQSYHRSYSIANAPNTSGRIEFAASYVKNGPGSEFLFHQLKPGDRVQARGPFGRLLLQESAPPRYVFIATSTGITPFRAMMPMLMQQLSQHADSRAVLLHGVKTRGDTLYHHEFMQWCAIGVQFSYRVYLSQEQQPIDPAQAQYHGHVQDAFPSLNFDPNHDIVYLCGNPNMVDNAFTLLKNQGFASPAIIREKYISR